MILDGYVLSADVRSFLVIGNTDTKYGRFLQTKYRNTNIHFLGAVYKKEVLDSLRYYCTLYFHGHSVGGTNPSLLEAMASQALIASHDNKFNKSVLNNNTLYFVKDKDVASIICNVNSLGDDKRQIFIENNKAQIINNYSWKSIIFQYDSLFREVLKKK